MEINIEEKTSKGIKIVAQEGKEVVGRIYIYLIYNDLHQQPYGLLEDLFVVKRWRRKGVATQLVKTALKQAKKLGCYKVIATSRQERTWLHQFYQELGFKKYGYEFRMDMN